ncbi:glycosyltransferase [Luteolibacter yonseiensis]|uniref:Glycosyltransferase n=1 Tax=Luteolibacter yonseiensis TaxID=1144680 RepID=A0A934V8D1_9BACT|nr:glycosyltransferase [Luteolibacter yonseiensis]MBK1817132.1 glycosyltransferase [Luteolibacter yonseiensis]
MKQTPNNKIIIFYPYIGEYGGIERNIIALSDEAIAMGCEPVLLCFYDRIQMEKWGPGISVVQLGEGGSPFAKARKVRQWLDAHRHEILGLPFFFGGKAGFYGGLAAMGAYALHYTDPPSLLSKGPDRKGVMKLLGDFRSKLSDKITSRGVSNARVRLTMTRWNAEELERCYSHPFDVIYQGGLLPEGEVVFKERCQGPVLRLFSICRLTGSKHLDWIVDAAVRLKQSPEIARWFDSFEIVIAGKGPALEDLKKHAGELGVTEIVSFPGFLDADQLKNTFQATDVFLVPGRQGYGLPVLEALYRNVPVVLNRESRISEILADNPWAHVTGNSSGEFSSGLIDHIAGIREKYPDPALLKDLPVEQGWASQIGKRCNWW